MYDRALNVNRAVKYVAPSRIYDPTQFYKEPHVLMELRHDHVVSVEDAGKLKDGTLYIAMEYLPKGSVESTYKGGPLPLSKALRILIERLLGVGVRPQSGCCPPRHQAGEYIARRRWPSQALGFRVGNAHSSWRPSVTNRLLDAHRTRSLQNGKRVKGFGHVRAWRNGVQIDQW